MAATMTSERATIIALYPDHASAEDAVRPLQKEGIPMQNLSIIGKNFQAVEKPLGFVTAGGVAGLSRNWPRPRKRPASGKQSERQES